MKLYYSTQSRAVRPRWMLEEIGAPYELVRLQLGTDTKTPAYLKINPNGTVPALVDGDLVLFESAAICQYLADRHPEKRLAPPVHYAMSGLEPPLVTIFLHTIRKPEAERIPALVAEARTQLGTVLGVIEQAVLGRTFILGDQLTAADVMVGSTLVWAQMMSLLGDQQPATAAYLARLASRPAFQRAMGD